MSKDFSVCVKKCCAPSLGGMISSARDLDVISVSMAGVPKRLSLVPQLSLLSESRLACILLWSSLSFIICVTGGLESAEPPEYLVI